MSPTGKGAHDRPVEQLAVGEGLVVAERPTAARPVSCSRRWPATASCSRKCPSSVTATVRGPPADATRSSFAWDRESTYVRKPPYFDGMTAEPEPVADITGAQVLASSATR